MPARRSKAIAVLIAIVAALIGFLGERSLLSGWSIDHSLDMRHRLKGDRHVAMDSPVVVLAIDEETFVHPLFRDTPMALWGPQLGRALAALDSAGAKIVGIDLIPSTTAETVAPGHDRPLLESLRRLATEGKLVMARADFADRTISPHPVFAFVAGAANIKSINVPLDKDGLTRHSLLWTGPPDRIATSFSAEIAKRAGIDLGQPDSGARHLVNFADRAVAPTYSFAEFITCLERGKERELSQEFAGRIVLLGATLDVEDRKVVSARSFVDGEAGYRHLDCADPPAAVKKPRRTSLPGVFILAQTINDLIRGETLRPAPMWLVIPGLLAMAGAGAALGWTGNATRGAIGTLGLLAAWLLLAGQAAASDMIFPVGGNSLALIAGFVLVFGFKALLVERQKRRLAHALGRYLDEKVAFQLLSSDQPIELGGEMREITVWFSDIAGFSTIAEGVAPKDLVRRLNAHFSILGEAIESEGGIIDKFVGDAVVAIFGAPQRQVDHAARALRAARKAIGRMRAGEKETGGFRVRIGINTGAALVGNVGSNRRFDYTAIGDAVNIAQRLEAANKEHGTTVLISAETAAAAGPGFLLRPVGAISVKGRTAKVEALELLSSEETAAE
jgi:class 3 adenylate cyclase/CHASE2 domain-containing sensor protein